MDWQVGDLAVCVDGRPCACCGEPSDLTEGAIYTVVGLHHHRVWGLYLTLGEVDPQPTANHSIGNSFDCDCFRKIRPDEHQACEPEFVTLLKRDRVTA